MRCKRMYVNTCLPLAGGLIKQTTAASDWSVRLQRTDRSQCTMTTLQLQDGHEEWRPRVLDVRELRVSQLYQGARGKVLPEPARGSVLHTRHSQHDAEDAAAAEERLREV